MTRADHNSRVSQLEGWASSGVENEKTLHDILPFFFFEGDHLINFKNVSCNFRLELSDLVRTGEIAAFIEIDKDFLNNSLKGEAVTMDFYAKRKKEVETREFIVSLVREFVQNKKLEQNFWIERKDRIRKKIYIL